jgi:hypothetical protein
MKTTYRTKDGLAVYDLDPLASELWAIAGPDGLDETAIDTDNLPDGCRWVDEAEWAALDRIVSETILAPAAPGVRHVVKSLNPLDIESIG